MNIKILYLHLLFVFSLHFCIKAQDIHFSNYYLVPLSLNPANTANYDGNWRLMCNYRQQGENVSNTYTSSAVAFDCPVYVRSEKLGLGAIYFYDNSASNTLLVNKLYMSASFFERIFSNSFLHLGLQAGIVDKRFFIKDLTFPDQFDMDIGYFNPDINSGDRIDDQSSTFLDLNWGLIWSRKTSRLNTEFGIGMFHFNKPKESFFSNNERLKPKYQIHGMVKSKTRSVFYIQGQALYAFQNKASELLIGTDIGLKPGKLNNLKDIYTGCHFRGGYKRISDALILRVGFVYSDYIIAFAYDIELAGQKT